MADPKDSTQSTKRPSRGKRAVFRGVLPYVVAALVTASVMAWYFFFYVPAKLDYFVGLRLRTLAVAAGQAKSKAETLARSLRSASRGDTADYLKALVPDLVLDNQGASASGLQLTTPGTPSKQPGNASNPPGNASNPPGNASNPPSLSATVAWASLMAQAAAVTTTDFDDLVLATSEGDVVWQRERTTPRIGNLREVLYAPDATGGWFSLSWDVRTSFPTVDTKDKGLPGTVAVKQVAIGVEPTLVAVQAVRLLDPGIPPIATSAGTSKGDSAVVLYVAATLNRNALQQQAMRVPLYWVLLLSLPVVLLFLALPFVKLATLTLTERYSFFDAAFLSIAAIVLAAIGASIPFIPTVVDGDTDQTLAGFAGEIEKRLIADTLWTFDIAATIVDSISPAFEDCGVSGTALKRRPVGCNLWTAPSTRLTRHQLRAELDVAIWLDDDGQQTKKWSTKTWVTGSTPHTEFQHFQDMSLGRLWRLGGASSETMPFTIDPLRSPTTSEVAVIFGFVPARSRGGLRATESEWAKRRFLAVNVRPPSVLDAIVPPGFGFAILSPDGKVLFHAEESLSLEENFFQEVGEPEAVRRRSNSRHEVTWSGDYHGRPHRFYLRPIQVADETPWRVVTFQELEPLLADVVRQQSGLIRLVAIELLLIGCLGVVLLVIAKLRHRDLRDFIFFSAQLRQRAIIVMVLVLIAEVWAFYSTYDIVSEERLDLLLMVFMAGPIVAITGMLAGNTEQSDQPDADGIADQRSWIAVQLVLLVVVVGSLPAMGFCRIVAAVETERASTAWLEAAQQRIKVRHERVARRVNGGRYDEIIRLLARQPEAFADAQRLEDYTYLSKVPGVTVMAASSATPGFTSAALERQWYLTNFLLRWNPLPSRDEATHPAVIKSTEGLSLASIDGKSPTLFVAHGEQRFPVIRMFTEFSAPAGKTLLGMLISVATLIAVIWARKRLLGYSTTPVHAFDDGVPGLTAKGDHAVLVIGPPQVGKDGAATALIRSAPGLGCGRIRLLDANLTEEVIKSRVRRWREQALRGQVPTRLWLHLSNLEAQLIDPGKRKAVLELLEQLFARLPAGWSYSIVVTSTIDPVAHFVEIFGSERQGIYNDAIPEVDLSRSASTLSRFRRTYVRIPPTSIDPWLNYKPSGWKETLEWEVSRYAPLAPIAHDLSLLWGKRKRVPAEELSRAVADRALPVYHLLWASCTRREKLALIQLAQEGFVTCQSADLVSALIAKGIIREWPVPATFNFTFRSFLRDIERDEVVQEWERMSGSGLWVVAGRLIGSSLIAGGMFFLLTQNYSVESILPIVSGTGLFSVPLIRNLVAKLPAFNGKTTSA